MRNRFKQVEVELVSEVLESVLRKLKADRQFSEKVHDVALSAYKQECSTMEEAFCYAFISEVQEFAEKEKKDNV